MKTLKKVYYENLEKINGVINVKELYCLPVFQEWLNDNEIEKIDMQSFIFAWKSNFDWYFSEKLNHNKLEKINNVYFSKTILNKNKYEILDFISEINVYIFILK